MTEQKKTLTIVDKATKGMNTAAVNLQKTVADLQSVANIAEGLAQEIEFKQADLDSIAERIKETERREKAELSIRILENEDSELTKLLTKRKLANISQVDLQELTSDLQEARTDVNVKVDKAVRSAVSKAEAKHKADTTELTAKQSVETATLKADIVALESKNANLQETVDSLREMLDNERKARVEISRNQQNIINVPKAG